MDKFPRNKRTFETRVKFIRDIFSNKFLQHEIMTSSIGHKLLVSLENYEDSVKDSVNVLTDKDPIKVLKANAKEK